VPFNRLTYSVKALKESLSTDPNQKTWHHLLFITSLCWLSDTRTFRV